MKRISERTEELLRRFLIPLFLLTISVNTEAKYVFLDTAMSSVLEGRWDLTIDIGGKEVPSWLEVRHSGLQTLVGDFVGSGGSARPISKINFDNGRLSFTIPPQWETGNDLTLEGALKDNALSGSI